jgi:hypothetical protein
MYVLLWPMLDNCIHEEIYEESLQQQRCNFYVLLLNIEPCYTFHFSVSLQVYLVH